MQRLSEGQNSMNNLTKATQFFSITISQYALCARHRARSQGYEDEFGLVDFC